MTLLSRFEVRVFLTAFVVLWIFGFATVSCGDRYDGPSKRCETTAAVANSAGGMDLSGNNMMRLRDDGEDLWTRARETRDLQRAFDVRLGSELRDANQLNKPEDDIGSGFGPCNSTPRVESTPMTSER